MTLSPALSQGRGRFWALSEGRGRLMTLSPALSQGRGRFLGGGEGLALFIFLVALLFVSPAAAEEVHGKTDVFAAPGVKLAWGIARGPDEMRTFVVVRFRLADAVDMVTVTGRDPFSGVMKMLRREAPTKGRLEVRIPRASFVDYPRTEWQLIGSGKGLPLTVFYLGIPDTTPEFPDEARLDAYLEARLGKL
jgi:hypothetical protein